MSMQNKLPVLRSNLLLKLRSVQMLNWPLGLIEALQEQPEKALKAYKKALGIQRQHWKAEHPSVAITRINIAEVLVDLKRFDEALKQLDYVQKTHVNAVVDQNIRLEALRVRGQALLGKNLVNQAIPLLEKALKRYREKPHLRAERAHTLWALAQALEKRAPSGDIRSSNLAREALTLYASMRSMGKSRDRTIRDWLSRRED